MNNLQVELDNINKQLELLNYRKNQLDSIMSEYSDVVNRVKLLVQSMEDANVEPSNFLIEIEGILQGVDEPKLTPESNTNHEKINAHIIPFDPLIHSEPEPAPLTSEPTPEPDDDNDFEYDRFGESEPTVEPMPGQTTGRKFFLPKCFWDYEKSLRLFINQKRRGKGEIEAIVNDCVEQGLCDRYDLNQCGDDWIVALSPVTSEDTVNRIIDEFYPKHTDGELTPTSEETSALTPEPVRLMMAVPTVVVPEKNLQPKTLELNQDNTSSGDKTTNDVLKTNKAVCHHQNQYIASDTAISGVKNAKTNKIQLNERAWRRDDTLLIGFTNKKLMNTWAKWARESWADRINITNYETLENFDHCLSILWYNRTDWERLKALDYSLKPDEQQAIKTENFEYKQANEKMTQIFRDGVLLGLAKDCGSHWESPQFKDEQFENREAVAVKLWELINNF